MIAFNRLAAAALAALLVNVAAAHADAVDGHWCYKDGRRLHIDGPNIMIPSGKRITGDYHRHGSPMSCRPVRKVRAAGSWGRS